MNDWLEILLTILKFAGVVVSGFAGLIAIASEKAKKKSPPKTKTGLILEHVFNKRWAIHWAIIGLVVAFLSQFSETLKVTLDEQKARRKEQQVSQIMQTQISLATSSLQKLEEQGATMHQEMLYLVSVTLTKVQDHQLHGTGTLETEHTQQSRILFMFIIKLGNTLLF